jgi:hypothetical protein
MKLRVIKVSKGNLNIALLYSTWASKRNRIKTWEIGDRLLFVSESYVIATAMVRGFPFKPAI